MSYIAAIRRFHCPQCDQKFTMKDKMLYHLKSCIVEKDNENEANLHALYRKEPEEKYSCMWTRICKLCDFGSAQYNNLKMHQIEVNHEGVKYCCVALFVTLKLLDRSL